MSLPAELFLADDSLGWVYQFWQSNEKARVNKSGEKIGADELPAVTQLFTEDYMVEFLLHNTLGAWWACRRFPGGVVAHSEEQARAMSELPINADLDALVSKIGLPQFANSGQIRFVAAPIIGVIVFYMRGLYKLVTRFIGPEGTTRIYLAVIIAAVWSKVSGRP